MKIISAKPFLGFFLCLLSCTGASQLHADPAIYTRGSFTHERSQTAPGGTFTDYDYYTSTLDLTIVEPGAFFEVSERFPSSITYSGITAFPNGQIEVVVPYGVASSPVVGPYYSGSAGVAGTPGQGYAYGYVYSNASGSSPDFNKVKGPITATLHGGVLDGHQVSAPFEAEMLPTVPLFTQQSLSALVNSPVDQAIALTFLQPLLPASPASFVNFVIFETSSYTPIIQDLPNPSPNLAGVTLPAGLLEEGHSYLMSVGHYRLLPAKNGYTAFYAVSNSVRFSVKPASVPEAGCTAVLLGSAFGCLSVLRRTAMRKAAPSLEISEPTLPQ